MWDTGVYHFVILPFHVLNMPCGGYSRTCYGAFAVSVPLQSDLSGTIEKCTALHSFYYCNKDKKLNHIVLHVCVN